MPSQLVRASRAGLVAVAAALLPALVAPTHASASVPPAEGAVVAFLPAGFDDTGEVALLPDLANQPGVALGLTSPSLGTYSRQQVLLDISQGSRISTRTYPTALGALYLRETDQGGGRIAGFDRAVARAAPAPGEIVPGLLGETVEASGGTTAYVGVSGLLQGEAIVAADGDGRIDAVSIGSGRSLVRRVRTLAGSHELVVTRLQRGGAGVRALDALMAEREPSQLIYAMRAPSVSFGLIPTAAAGQGYAGLLTSPTTRQPGLVTATDVAPTVLAHLGLAIPPEVQGQPVGSIPGADPIDELISLDERQQEVTERRIPTLLILLGAWLGLMAILTVAARSRGARAGMRIGLLSLIWLPCLALITAALQPGATTEFAILVLGSLVISAATDRLLPWPAAPALPAAVLFVSHTIDLALGSPLIIGSLAGPTPRGGARFYGIGNELETIMIVTVLIGIGAALAGRGGAHAGRWFAIGSVVVGAVIGAGRLGADVGGVITLGAGGAVAVLASLPGRPGRRAVAIAVLAPVLALAALVAIDLATGGGSHFSRFVLEASGPGELIDIASRRLELAYAIGLSGATPIIVAVFAVVVAAGIWKRRELLAPLIIARGELAARAFAAGIYGALAAIVFGSVANDSGPRIFVIGAIWIVFAGAYAWAAPHDMGRAVR